MRTLMTAFFAVGLLAQGQSGSTQSQDVPHQEPGTDSPDLGKQRVPAPKQSPGTKSPAEGSNDVPHQQPGTDSPDLGKQRQASPGTTTSPSKTKGKRKKNKSTAVQG